MKKAFTLSEALITLAILGVLAAILIPVLDNVRPDKDKIMYKKAMYAMQSAADAALDEINNISTNATAFWADDYITNLDSNYFCKSIANVLNITQTTNKLKYGNGETSTTICSQTWSTQDPEHAPSATNVPDFMTTDGTIWWKLGHYKFGTTSKTSDEDNAGKTADNDVHDIYITRKDQYDASGNMKTGAKPLRIRVRYDGKVGTGDNSAFDTENGYLEDSFNISQGHR